MRLRTLPSKAAKTNVFALEPLEHRLLLVVDTLASDLPQNMDLVSSSHADISWARYETVDDELVVLPGDANRDGLFDQQDVVEVLAAGKYLTSQSADWGEGDWNGDHVFDQRDVVIALQIRRSSDDQAIAAYVRAPKAPPGLQDLTSSPSPATRGPYGVCVEEYEFRGSGSIRSGLFYVPALTITRDGRCITHGKFPLLLIAHADGVGVGAGSYDELARHLASNAIIVASMDRDGVSPEEFADLLTDHVDYIYGSSAIKDFVLNDIALLGHSAGGRSVIQNAGVIHEGNLPVLGEPTDKELKAVILLASTVDADLEKTFEGETAALMGMNVVIDSDVNAYGGKMPGEVMQSTFRIYDEAGLIQGQPNDLSLEKAMVFANGSDITQPPHYFQNAIFSQGYINAFLQLHLRDHDIYRRFFKQQEKIPQVSTQVFLQYAEDNQLLVANFENGSVEEHTLGGSIQVMGNSIENLVVGEAHQLDEFSPHHTMVMKFDWPGDPGQGPPDRIRFRFDDPQNLLPYRYVALRITQVYDPTTNAEGTPRDFSVRLHTQSGDASAPVSMHGGELHFPLVAGAPLGALQEEQTKNAMRSYVIPLTAFEGIDQAAVEELVLDFSDVGEESTSFILDDVAFWS